MSAEQDMLEAFEVWMQSRLEQVHTMLPGRIQTYDKATRIAVVKPSVMPRTLHGEVLDIPPIAGIPVIWPSSSAFSLVGELEAGDGVMLVFSESSIGSWLKGATTTAAEDETRFSLQDAVAVAGLWSRGTLPSNHLLKTAAWGLASQALTIGGTEEGLAVIQNEFTDLRTEMTRALDDLNLAHQNLVTQFNALAAVAATGSACLIPVGPTTPLQAAFLAAAASETAAQAQITSDKALLGRLLP